MVDDEESIDMDFPRSTDNVRGASLLSSGNPPLQKYHRCSLHVLLLYAYTCQYLKYDILIELTCQCEPPESCKLA